MLIYDEWVDRHIRAFRARCEELEISPDAPEIGGLPTLFAPTQVHIIGTFDPRFQLMLVTHDSRLLDLQRFVQVEIPVLEFVGALETFKDRPEFSIPRPASFFFPAPHGNETLGGFLDRWLASLVANGWTRIVRAKAGWMSTVNVGGGIFLQEFRGSLTDQVPEKRAIEMADFLKRAMTPPVSQEVRQQVRVAQADAGEPAFGAYIFPAVQVGNRPPLSFRERAAGVYRNFRSPKVVIRTTFRRVPISVDYEGLVMILTTDRAVALDRLNRLMAALLFLGLPTLAVRDSELIQGSVVPETCELKGSTASLSSLRNIGIFETRGFPGRVAANKVETEDFEKALESADRMTGRQALSQDLLLFLESTSHLVDQEYTPAFLMSWAILERRLSARWRKHLFTSGVTRDRMRKLSVAERWSVDYLIESLDLLHQLPEGSEYGQLVRLKDRRNSIVHSGRAATNIEVQEVADLAHIWLRSAVAEEVGTMEPLTFRRSMQD